MNNDKFIISDTQAEEIAKRIYRNIISHIEANKEDFELEIKQEEQAKRKKTKYKSFYGSYKSNLQIKGGEKCECSYIC